MSGLQLISTIDVCRLDSPDLLDMYTQHVQLNVLPEVQRIHQAMLSRNRTQVHTAWNHATQKLLYFGQAYVALSHDALDHFFPSSDRAKWGLALTLLF